MADAASGQASQPDSQRARVVAVHGAVIDVAVAGGRLPAVNDALHIEWDQPAPMIAEVQAHLDTSTVRAIALRSTGGLARGTPVIATGAPVTVPVGPAVLGRLLDVIGEVRDGGAALPAGSLGT